MGRPEGKLTKLLAKYGMGFEIANGVSVKAKAGDVVCEGRNVIGYSTVYTLQKGQERMYIVITRFEPDKDGIC